MGPPLNKGPRATKIPTWAESLKTVDLRTARSLVRKQQKESGPQRSGWKTFAFPEIFLDGATAVGCFAPRSDWDEPMAPSLPAPVKKAYPWLHENGEMIFRECADQDLIFNERWKVFEAPAHHRELLPEVLLVPCLLADALGQRIGRGGGFYDRFLKQHTQVRAWGLLHSDYVLSEIPSAWLHAGDQKLQGLITEKSIIPTQDIPNYQENLI